MAKLADAVRDDAMFAPAAFPAGFAKTAQKATDETLANWFLEQLDRIEAGGYNGTVYSRNGVNNMWVVTRYIAGSHNWEDIEGTLNMNLLKFYTLKNRDMLDANHQDLQQFKSVRELGQYMVYHYSDKLKDLEQQLANAAKKKTSRAIKVVDNDDYSIYMILNRNASCIYGLGANWCTANTSSGNFFHSYSGRAALFQIYPKKPQEVNKNKGGKAITGNERYQFDAGGPNFMDIADDPVRPDVVAKRFPYLGDDLVTSLQQNAEGLQGFIDKAIEDPALQQSDDTKVKPYKVEDEVQKLRKMYDSGYFTKEKRPAEPAAPEQIAQA